MQAEGTPKHRHASAWREAADLLRFCLEAGAVSGAIVMLAWIFSASG